jgi:hypothetical protein
MKSHGQTGILDLSGKTIEKVSGAGLGKRLLLVPEKLLLYPESPSIFLDL